MSIASSPGLKINMMKSDIGTSTEDIAEEYNEIVDTLAIGSDSDTPIDPEEYMFDISKIDDNGIFPISAPIGNIRRSKSRTKKPKKKHAMAIIGSVDTACQDCQTPEFGDRREQLASPTASP